MHHMEAPFSRTGLHSPLLKPLKPWRKTRLRRPLSEKW
jgi:hypothetical protein